MRPSDLRRTTKGIAPCSSRIFNAVSTYEGIDSGVAMKVYQRFHNSPSRAASCSSGPCSACIGSSTTQLRPVSVTGSMKRAMGVVRFEGEASAVVALHEDQLLEQGDVLL